jgi:cytochrome c oxidase assembly factor 1
MFETTEWSLETTDGRKIDLLEGDDPFKAIQLGDDALDVEEEDAPATRGFRK